MVTLGFVGDAACAEAGATTLAPSSAIATNVVAAFLDFMKFMEAPAKRVEKGISLDSTARGVLSVRGKCCFCFQLVEI